MRMRLIGFAILGLVFGGALPGCGAGSSEEEASATARVERSTPLSQMEELPRDRSEDTEEGPTAGLSGYVSQDDPDAFYTLEDIPDRGRYPEIDFTGLEPEVLNRVIHRLRTELCSCGCKGMTIDMCIYDDPDCGVAPEHARKIILEEQRKGS